MNLSSIKESQLYCICTAFKEFGLQKHIETVSTVKLVQKETLTWLF